MERETSQKKTLHGIQMEEETIRVTPEDGTVSKRTIEPVNFDPDLRGKYHKGYSTTKTYTTGDPRIIRPVVYGICGVFFAVGLLMLLFRQWFFAVVFLFTSILSFTKLKKQIDHISERRKKQGLDVTIDSQEEKEALRQDVEDTLKTALKDSAKENFSEERITWFTKATLPIYVVICLAVSILLGIFAHVIIGVVAFVICTIVGVVYYFVFLKWLVKQSQK